jgi:hypothetical protein
MGSKKLEFGGYDLITAKKRTKLELFLAELEAVVLWQALIPLIEPY